MIDEPVPPDEIVRRVREVFFFPLDEAAALAPLESVISQLPPGLSGLGQSFVQNLRGVASTLSAPTRLAVAAAHQLCFQRIHMTEWILVKMIGEEDRTNLDTTESARDKRVAELTEQKVHELLRSKDGLNELRSNAFRLLAEMLESSEFVVASGELLRSGAVLLWGAFEVLARDVFVEHVNRNPQCVLRLTQNPTTKKKFDLRSLSLDSLASYGFDVSHDMGHILLDLHDLSDLGSIKDVYGALFPKADSMREALAAGDLWVLSQRRHLLVRRRGIVDTQYLENTKEDLQVGSLLKITPRDIEAYFRIVRDAGKEMLAAPSENSLSGS